jgi:hypothetical protein
VTAPDPAARSDAGDGPVLGEEECERIGRGLGEIIARFEAEDYSLLAWHRCDECRQPHEPCSCAGQNFAIPDLVDHVAALLVKARADVAAEERKRLIQWLLTLANLREDADPLPSGSDGRGLAVDLRWAADRLQRRDPS